MKETHVIKLPSRTVTVTVEELEDRILVSMKSDKYGNFNDEKLLMNWMLPVFRTYDTDKRPIVFKNPHSGEVATIFGTVNNSVAFIKRPIN